jgi:hypothetical protein
MGVRGSTVAEGSFNANQRWVTHRTDLSAGEVAKVLSAAV